MKIAREHDINDREILIILAQIKHNVSKGIQKRKKSKDKIVSERESIETANISNNYWVFQEEPFDDKVYTEVKDDIPEQ